MKLALTLASANLLAQLSATPGLLKDAATLYRVGAYAEAQLADLAVAPPQPAATAPQADWQAWNELAKAWGRTPLELEATDRQRDALRSLVKSAIEAGAIPASAHVAVLLRALGLQPED